MPGSPYKRRKTRHRGISFRERAGGSRTYYVYAGGRHRIVDGAEKEALLLQAELRTKGGRGENLYLRQAVFAELAEAWYTAKKSRTRYSTWSGYRIALDKY